MIRARQSPSSSSSFLTTYPSRWLWLWYSGYGTIDGWVGGGGAVSGCQDKLPPLVFPLDVRRKIERCHIPFPAFLCSWKIQKSLGTSRKKTKLFLSKGKGGCPELAAKKTGDRIFYPQRKERRSQPRSRWRRRSRAVVGGEKVFAFPPSPPIHGMGDPTFVFLFRRGEKSFPFHLGARNRPAASLVGREVRGGKAG